MDFRELHKIVIRILTIGEQNEKNTSRDVYADSAYRSAEHEVKSEGEKVPPALAKKRL